MHGYDHKRYRPDGTVNDTMFPVENWIGYTLSPGANWRWTRAIPTASSACAWMG